MCKFKTVTTKYSACDCQIANYLKFDQYVFGTDVTDLLMRLLCTKRSGDVELYEPFASTDYLHRAVAVTSGNMIAFSP